jgi:hypothetical protein
MPTRRTLDQFDRLDQSDTAEMKARVARTCEDFQQDCPDYYGSEENTRLLLAWLANEGVPISRLNLTEAYEQLCAMGDVLEERQETVIRAPKDSKSQGDRGVQKMGSMDTVKLRHKIGSDAQRQLVGENYQRLHEIMVT